MTDQQNITTQHTLTQQKKDSAKGGAKSEQVKNGTKDQLAGDQLTKDTVSM